MVRCPIRRPWAASRLSYRFLYLRWNTADMKPFGTTTMEDLMYATSDEGSTMSVVVQGSRRGARVICNPSSGGGSCDPYRLREQLSDFELDWIETRGPSDTTPLWRPLANLFKALSVGAIPGRERTRVEF